MDLLWTWTINSRCNYNAYFLNRTLIYKRFPIIGIRCGHSGFDISLPVVKLSWLLPLSPVQVNINTREPRVGLPVILLVGPVVDEVGDQEGRHHREHRGADAPQSVGHLRFTKKMRFSFFSTFLKISQLSPQF